MISHDENIGIKKCVVLYLCNHVVLTNPPDPEHAAPKLHHYTTTKVQNYIFFSKHSFLSVGERLVKYRFNCLKARKIAFINHSLPKKSDI
jgi:hypothetical protein